MAGELGGTRQASEGATSAAELRYCAAPPRVPLALPPGLDPVRARAIVLGRAMWANGTVLHYYFFDRDGASDGAWVGEPAQQDAVRAGFQAWKELGIGLEFREVADRSEAEVRIGFMDGDGSWSYLGRDVLRQGSNARTMNFGWDLTTAHGRTTALHEIGHTLGMPHEHQNPFAGIVWDEAKVFEFLGGPPNNWDRETTFHNVLRKLDPGEVPDLPEPTVQIDPAAFFEPELKGRWGAAKLAAMTKAPVIPLGLWGTEKVWPRSARIPNLLNVVEEAVELELRRDDAAPERRAAGDDAAARRPR